MLHRSQRGAVLVASLLILLVMTMLVLASVNSSTVNMRITNNLRAQQDARSIVRLGIEGLLSDVGNFTDTPPTSVTVDLDGDGSGDETVTLSSPPDCVHSRPATGYSAVAQISPEDTTWEFEATYQTDDGATATMRQGVQIRMTSGSCT